MPPDSSTGRLSILKHVGWIHYTKTQSICLSRVAQSDRLRAFWGLNTNLRIQRARNRNFLLFSLIWSSSEARLICRCIWIETDHGWQGLILGKWNPTSAVPIYNWKGKLNNDTRNFSMLSENVELGQFKKASWNTQSHIFPNHALLLLWIQF